MPKSTRTWTTAEWRGILRQMLRECSYLPDPVARTYIHDHIVLRFRRYMAPKAQAQLESNVKKRKGLEEAAKKRLSVLRRANAGYTKPLQRVLFQAYGRTGKRRAQLLAPVLSPNVSQDNEAVRELLKQPARFDDGWEPPTILMAMVNSQRHNPIVANLIRGTQPRLNPNIPRENSFGRPLSGRVKRNQRRQWYTEVTETLLPPLPSMEHKLLEGLIDGSVPLRQMRRRKPVGSLAVSQPTATGLDDFLVEGPQKGQTFEAYAAGRPHHITRRFMRRLWLRVYALVPTITMNPETDRVLVTWPSLPEWELLTTDDENESSLFTGLDDNGMRTKVSEGKDDETIKIVKEPNVAAK